MSKIKITWKAFGDKPAQGKFVTSIEFESEFKVEDPIKLCEVIYHVTNTYSGNLWEIIQPLLSDLRTHTSISVGDEIEIDGQVYICADFGFEKIEDVKIRKVDDVIYSVEVGGF
jgi:hypothetical protein